MTNYLAYTRSLFTLLLLAVAAPVALAQATGRSGQAQPAQAGDLDLGLLIIVGAVGFFILLAWLFSRMGNDGGQGPDHTML